MKKTCMQITYSPIVHPVFGIRLSTYGGHDIGEDPRLARIDSDVPNAMINKTTTNVAYLRNNSLLHLDDFMIYKMFTFFRNAKLLIIIDFNNVYNHLKRFILI